MGEIDGRFLSAAEAASLLGDAVTADHVLGRLRRGSRDGEQADDGTWRGDRVSVEQALAGAPICDGCGRS